MNSGDREAGLKVDLFCVFITGVQSAVKKLAKSAQLDKKEALFWRNS
jgi:hypothetical protein